MLELPVLNHVIPECFNRESRNCANFGSPTKAFGDDTAQTLLGMTQAKFYYSDIISILLLRKKISIFF